MTKGEQTRQRIVKSTVDLIIENKLGNRAVAAIIERADVSRTTFYRHFDSLDDVIQEAAVSMIPVEVQDIDSPEDFVDGLIQMVSDNMKFFAHLEEHHDKFDYVFKQIFLQYTFTIRNAMDGGNPIHAELTFRAIVGIMEGWMSNLSTISAKEVKEFINHLVVITENGNFDC